ncbi:MAG: putative Phenylalanine racemase (ATP-hydrolyzing), partial [Burkholderiales bacterium]|nr:putative Phenylalanine racemase (ATP-hydrolyzing) [Burkholderiales bacterium]
MYKVKLSPYHKIFYNEWKLDPKSSKYNIVFDQTISSTLDVECLKAALGKFIAEHLVFNSHILEKDDEAYWIENPHKNQLEVFDDGYTPGQVFEYVSRPFNLISEPLYRFAVFKEVNNSYRFIAVVHHLVIDGNGFNSFISTISNYYNSKKYAFEISLEEQVKLLATTTKTFEQQLEPNTKNYSNFWETRLAGIEAVDLRFLKPCIVNQLIADVNPIKELRFKFNKADIPQLTNILAKYTITEYNYSQCIFAILLNRYTGQNKFAISYPVAIEGSFDLVYGSKINTNIIPFIFSNDTTALKLFKAAKDFVRLLKSGKFNYSNLPIDQIISTSHSDILNVMFAKTNLKDTPLNFKKAKTISINKDFNIDLYCKLCFEYESNEQELGFRVRYNSLETDEVILQNFVKHYQKLFIDVLLDLAASCDENSLISKYQVLFPEEYQQIVYEWNKTEKEYPHDKTIHQLFEEQVAKTPDNIAVVFEDKQLTYRELNQSANQLAHYLREKYQIKGDDLIALCLERNEYQLIAILAVLKAGSAYVPMDPNFPNDRISFILSDTRAKVILSNKPYYNRLFQIIEVLQTVENSFKNKCIIKNKINLELIEDNERPEILIQLSTDPELKISSNNLAYVIYTSGTTGKPKGVMIEHKSIVNFIYGINSKFDKADGYINAGFTAPYTFDVSIFDIWSNLQCGNCIFIIPNNILLSTEQLNYFIDTNYIKKIYLSAKLFKIHATMLSENKCISQILTGVESIYTSDILPLLGSKEVLNGYGPTETTVCATTYSVNKKSISRYKELPIGKPLQNIQCYVVDNNLNPIPIGCIGELLIGGEGVARGYINHSQLTKEKFIINPFYSKFDKQISKNANLYKTGDLVRYTSEGNLEYIGRNDSQVKINGYRIELREIECILMNYPGITEVVAIVKEHGDNKYIGVYYTAKVQLNITDIKIYLASKVPSYMLPANISPINDIPLTTSGKLDKNALLQLDYMTNSYTPPSNEKEQIICDAFSTILNIKNRKIGVNDDFFEFGGTSITAIKLASVLQINFCINISDIFNLRTPMQLAQKPYSENTTLQEKLKFIKTFYNYTAKIQTNTNNASAFKLDDYLKKIDNIKIDLSKVKPITNVLLTGATGYLGCNLLNQLLKLTDYKVYLIIRANSDQEAYNRVNTKFKYFFKKNLYDFYESRVVILAGNIEKSSLGLLENEYLILTKNIDTVIHAAALVKHYGRYEAFYSANVQATVNLLEFTKLTRLKDFHYISTYSVLNYAYTAKFHNYLYIEDDIPDISERRENVYIHTKLLGEHEAIKYRLYGVTSTIYRIGNLAFMAENYEVQSNLDDHAFFNWIRGILELKLIAKEIALVEISPTDITATAIIKLFDKQQLANNIYHVFNPYLFDLSSVVIANTQINVASIHQFIDYMIEYVNNTHNDRVMLKFLLRQGWLNNLNATILDNSIKVLQNRTQSILKQLNFEWGSITSDMFTNYIKKSLKKMAKKQKILDDLNRVAQMLPSPIYWEDTNSVILGANELVLQGTGANTPDNYIGKTLYELYPKEMADNIKLHNEEVMRTGKILAQEESIKDIATGETKYYIAVKSPLLDDDGSVIGLVGTSIDITDRKERARLEIEVHKAVAEQLRLENENHKAIVESERLKLEIEANKVALAEKEKFIALKESEYLKHENKKLEAQNKLNQLILEKEAAEKEADRLRLENEVQKLENEKQRAVLEEQDRFRKFVGQVVHDIRSPLASLRGLVDASSSIIPEQERITLRQASMRITDIAQNMLREYKNEVAENEIAEPVLVPAAILEVLSEKRYEYNTVNFNHDFLSNTDFAFIQIEPSQFKRMMSNLLNNAVEAIEGKADGKINLVLNVDSEWVNITITDNGKGMPKELIEKIENDIAVSEGKENGSGIGFTQIRDTIKRNFGEFKIFSTVDVRTSILIKFPKIPAPYWIAQEIKI